MTTSHLALGAMMFGSTVDGETSFALLDRFVEAGGRWIDTADCYSFWASESGRGGGSEALIGRWLTSRPGMRDRVSISTKVGAEPRTPGDWPASRTGLSATAIRDAVAGSLERLAIDRIDLLWAHMEDRSVPIEESAEAFSALVDAGRVARVGASNHPAWRVERARAHIAGLGGHPFSAIQLSRTYLSARPDAVPAGQDHRFGLMRDEQIDHAVENGMELWAYTPLLSGAYDNPDKPIPDAYRHPGTTSRLDALDRVACELGASRSQVVLAWLAGGTPAIRPIVGGSRLDQLNSALDGVALPLSAAHRELLDGAAA